MRVVALLALAGVLAACTAPDGPGQERGAGSPPSGPDTCDAAAYQSLIGRNIGAVTFPADADIRVACTTCAVTQDYRSDRMNIRFNEETGVIEEVSCG